MPEASPYDYDDHPYNFNAGSGRKRRTRSAVLAQYRAALSEEFLCETGIPEIDELRDEHVRLVREMRKYGSAANTLRNSYEEEDRDVRAKIRAGRKPEARTPKDEREEHLEVLDLQIEAAAQAVLEHVDRIIDVVREQDDAWRPSLKAGGVAAAEKRAEAERLMAEAWEEQMRTQRLYTFLTRIYAGNVQNFLPGVPMMTEPISAEPRPSALPANHPGLPKVEGTWQ